MPSSGTFVYYGDGDETQGMVVSALPLSYTLSLYLDPFPSYHTATEEPSGMGLVPSPKGPKELIPLFLCEMQQEGAICKPESGPH
jgi:hypothetical protein